MPARKEEIHHAKEEGVKMKFLLGPVKIAGNEKGKVEKVEEGPITANVKIKIEAPTEITAVITKESVKDLNIKVGDDVVAIIKATEVMVGKE